MAVYETVNTGNCNQSPCKVSTEAFKIWLIRSSFAICPPHHEVICLQAARVQQLRKQLEASADRTQAQQLPLTAITAQPDAGRSIVTEVSEGAQVATCTICMPDMWHPSPT